MPAPRNTYDKTHLKDISSYLRKIDDIFREAAGEAAAIGASVRGGYDPGKPFSFDDYPKTKKRVESLLKGLERGIETVVTDGVTEQWGLSNAKNDEAARKALGKAADNLTREQRERYFSDHAAALKAFRERKVDGLGLSDRVWRYTDQFREEIEMGIYTGLSEGRSADQMSRDLRGYLRNPDKLFRRVRDARGNLVLSGNAKAYHPGAGVYRSSYRNARRLAATETNMAYRTADHERWRDMDFVVGIEIQTSNNHTLDGKPLEDICDTLAGRYPKEFKFTGWHPQCRCFATTILKTGEELRADNERISAGEEPLPASESENYIGNTPWRFNNWTAKNLKRIEAARQNGTLPYFIKDNENYITIKELGNALLDTAKGTAGVDWSELEKAIKKADISEIRKQMEAVRTDVEKVRADGETNLAAFNDRLKNAGVTTLDVKNLKEPLSPTEITNRVGGGDLTKGSCASLALAYAGERCGYDVLDYRDGQSRRFFSMNYHDLTKAVGGLIATNRNANTAARELFNKTVKGREYILGVGKHAAVVRKGADGMEYLELQSPTTNGFKSLKTVKELQWRFKSKNSWTVGGYKIEQEAYLIDVDILKNNKEFKKLLEYINTAENEQKKGAKGTIK